MLRRVELLGLLILVCCGSPEAQPQAAAPASGVSASAPAASEAPALASSAAPAPAAEAPRGIPMSCASSDPPCMPDPRFVKRLCDGAFPDVALVLLSKEAPFARMYMKGDVDGWNAEGGASARARLFFDEEVLVLRRRAPPSNGIVVGAGGAGYLVMRWDGNCYTLEQTELSSKRPPSPRYAPIPWRFYSEKTKDALLQSAKVRAAYKKRGKECKGAVSGAVSKACEAADTALSAVVVAEVRAGMTVPTPDKLP